MKKYIELKPTNQTGHNCKTTAIATIEHYFAQKLGFVPIPLHKNKLHPISIRQLSKTKGSIQGELLEIRQFSEMFTDLGYKSELIDFQNDYDSFVNNVTSAINSGNLVLACFAVDRTTGLPTINYDMGNEHAAILHGYDDANHDLHITHWGQSRKTNFRDFYDSSMVLPAQRDPEYYMNIKSKNKQKKYDLCPDQTGSSLPPSYKQSMIPSPNSGFKGKLLIIKQPNLEALLEGRKKILHYINLQKLFAELKLKITELSSKANIDEEYKEKTKFLIDTLEPSMKSFLAQDFKSIPNCIAAIKSAEPAFKKHRGWHQVHIILRSILGILALFSVIPAVTVAYKSRHGYLGTFFKTPTTDSEEKLELFKQALNNFQTS